MNKSLVVTVLAAAIIGGGALIANVQGDDSPPSPSEFVIYDHDDLYWAFTHADTICDTAQRSVLGGLNVRGATDEAIGAFPQEADTAAVAVYVRGLLRGCVVD